MQHVIAAEMISIVYSNIHSYVISNWYVTQVQMQKHTKQVPETSCKVYPGLNLTILINYYIQSLTM